MTQLPPVTRSNPPFSVSRVGAMVLRYWYLLKGSWPRILELGYWPSMNLLMWGFLQTYLNEESNVFVMAGGTLVGAVLLWDMLFRGQLGFAISFFEEMWSRNFGHLMVSPLRPIEFVAALTTMSILRTVIGLVPAVILAIWFFGFNLFGLGIALVAFFANLMVFGWAVGLIVTGIILRNGMGAESLAWAVPFVFLPLCGIYYPVSVLPGWLESIALALPPTYVFEGMRGVLLEGVVDWANLAWAAGLNVVFFGAGYTIFTLFLRAAKERGMLLSIGE